MANPLLDAWNARQSESGGDNPLLSAWKAEGPQAVDRIMSRPIPRSLAEARAQEDAAAQRAQEEEPRAPKPIFAPKGTTIGDLTAEAGRYILDTVRGRAISGEAQRDAAQNDGIVDRLGSEVEAGAASAIGGLQRAATTVLAPVAPESRLKRVQREVAAVENAGNVQVAGSVGDLRDVESAADLGNFIVSQAFRSAPEMAITALPGIGLATEGVVMTGRLGQQRAQNDGHENATIGDLAKAAPAAAASAALEKTGIERIFGPTASTIAGRIGQAAAGEAATEFLQEGVEYAGSNLGTEAGFDPKEAFWQAAGGAVAGAGMGASIRGGVEMADAAGRVRTPGIRETAEKQVLTPSPEDVASPLDTADIAAGRAVLSQAETGQKADAVLASAGLPKVSSRVEIADADGNRIHGVIEDVFERDGDGGVKIRLDDGRLFEEHFTDIADAGVTIREAKPASEIAADAAETGGRSLPPGDAQQASPSQPGSAFPTDGGTTLPTTAAEIDADLATRARDARQRLQATLDAPPPALPASPAAQAPTPSVPAMADGAEPKGTPASTIDGYMARTRRAESGGDDTAKNPRSSATGRYQFTDGTWIATYRAEFGNTDETPTQILAKRGDGALQDRLMRRLTESNAKALQGAGIAITEGNLYLAHFAGEAGARRIIKADPATPIEAVLGQDAVNANPFLKGKTAGDVVRWAAAKMGSKVGGEETASLAVAPADATVDPYATALEGYKDWAGRDTRDDDGSTVQTAGADMRGEPINEGWVRFADNSATLNIPRSEMPQIKAEHRGAMVNFMNARGIDHAEEIVDPTSLKPSQEEFSPQKVQQAKDYAGGNRAILISSDGHIVDGHHQWLAARDKGEEIRAIRLDAPIRDVLAAAHDFPSSTVAQNSTDSGESRKNGDAVQASSPKLATGGVPASPALSESAPTATIETMPSGKSIAVMGASETELAAISAAVPRAKAIPRSDGALVYAKSYESKIREALASASNPPARSSAQIRTAPQTTVTNDVAITPAGREVPVEYAVAELGDLVTSHTADGAVNPAFPAALQPRDRSRGTSQAQIAEIAGRLDPRLLGRSIKASDGAPIISPDGVVESGNGRTLALARAYQLGGDRIAGYRQFLNDEGFNTEGIEQPVLVRVRRGDMADADVEAFTREANQRETAGFSATEQAASDSAAMPPATLDLYRGGDIDAAGNRAFVRSFMDAVVPATERANMVAADGSISQDALRRIGAALLHRAYGNSQLVARLNEATDSNIKAIGGALSDVSAAWAKLVEAAQDGRIDPAMDITRHLNEAVDLVDRARREGVKVADLVNQRDIFSGEAVSARTEAVLQLMFRNRALTQPVSRQKLAERLTWYVDQAMLSTADVGLFGAAEKTTPDEVIGLAQEKFGEQPSGQGDLLTEARSRDAGDGGRVRQGQRERNRDGESALRESGEESHAQSERVDQSGSPERLSTPEVLPLVATLTGREIGRATDMRDMGNKARAWFRQNLRLRTIMSSDGVPVRFNRDGEGKLRGGDRILRAVPAIRAIIENGQHKGPLAPSAKWAERGAVAAHHYSARVSLDGEVRTYGVLVQEFADGRRFYSLTDSPSEDAGSRLSLVEGRPEAGARVEITPGADINLTILDADSNADANVPDLADLQARLESYGIARKVALRLVDTLDGAAGSYADKLITVATDAPQNGAFTLDHEAIHFLREQGLFNNSEWAILAAKARRDPGLMRSIRQRYPRLDAEAQMEEAVADLFARYQRGDYKAEGTMARVFKALRQALEAIGNAFRGRGLRSAKSVLGDVARAEIGGRDVVATQGSKVERRSVPDRDGKPDPDQRITIVAAPAPPVGGTFTERRLKTKAAAIRLIANQSYLNEDQGREILVNGNSVKHSLDSTRSPDDLALTMAIPDLLRAAVRVNTEPGRNGGLKHDFYAAARMTNGELRRVRITVLEGGDGLLMYSQHIVLPQHPVIEEGVPGSGARSIAEAIPAGQPGTSITLGNLLHEVKNPDGTRIFDSGDIRHSIPEAPFERRADGSPDGMSHNQTTSLIDSLRNGANWPDVREKIDDWRVWVQDKMLPVLRAQEATAQALGRDIAEAENPYLSEELMTGRAGARLERLSDDIVDPLFEAMHREGISVDELETFLYARHAKERNTQIAKINPEFAPGEGSGMTDTQARAILNRIDRTGKRDTFDTLAGYVDRMLSDAMQTRVEAGLLSQEEADAWRATYQHYVPLRGHREVEGEASRTKERVRQQSGVSVRGKEGKRAFGRRSEADSILAYSILQAEEAIVRAEKNRAAQAFLKLAQANPDANLWEVNKVRRVPVMNKATGLVRYEMQSRLAAEDAPYTVSAKVDGDEYHVTMNRDNERAVKVAEAMRNLEDPKFGKTMALFSGFNRYFSAINTRYNPSFVITNAVRDLQTMAVIGQQFDMPGLTRGVVRDYFRAMTAKKHGDGEWSRWRNEWEMAGGKVYYNQTGDLDQIRKDLAFRTKQKANPRSMAARWHKTFDAIEAMNDSVERAIRLAVYKNARERGKSPAEAASMARNITVNFTRKGRLGPVLNSFYAFFNASTQGSANLILAAAKSKKVRAAMAGFIVAGFLTDMLNAMLSGDDDDGESFWDKVPEHEKSRNVMLMLPGGDNGQAIKIPLAYGLNALFGLGRNASAIMRGAMSPGEAVLGSAMEFADAFNPVGGGGSWQNIVFPTMLDPLIDVDKNRDFAGKPIQPEQNPFGSEATPSSNYFPSVSGWAKGVAKGLNAATGGDDVVPGAASVSPEVIEYLAGYLTGGAGRFVSDFANVVISPADIDSEITIRDVPIAKSVLTEKAPWIDKSRYYERIHEVRQVADRAKQYQEREDADGLQAFVEATRAIGRMEGATKEADKIMAKVRKARNETSFDRELGRIDDATYRERMDRIQAAEEKVISAYNARWVERVEKAE